MSKSLDPEKNADSMKLLLSAVRRKLNKIKLGGGQKNIEKQHAKGKMTARERVDYLLDEKSDRIEIGPELHSRSILRNDGPRLLSLK